MNLHFSLCQSAEDLKCAWVEENKRWYFSLITAGEQIINQDPESEKKEIKELQRYSVYFPTDTHSVLSGSNGQ